MKSNPYLRSFVGGVVSPAMLGRIDDATRDNGLAACRNMIVLPEGVVTSRPGTKYVRGTRYNARRARMIPFRYSSTQTTALEFGHAYIRFHSFGGTLLTPTSGVSAWSAVPTYNAGDLVTYGGSTWYAVINVPANQQPDLTEWGQGTPVVTASWVETAASSATPPVGYTYVGTELPAVATIGQLVYISVTEYVDELVLIDLGPFGFEYVAVPTPTTRYLGYTGTAGGSITGSYWYKMGVVYEIPSPYDETHLADIHYVQSGDILTLVHPLYAPRELRRNGATNWTLKVITFGSTLSAPTIANVVATTVAAPSDLQPYTYVATNVADDQLDESVASASDSDNNQLADSGAYNTISFGSAARRNVYRLTGGLYGFIGQTVTTTLIDDNIAPDVSLTPPLNQNPFSTDWPAAVTYYGQRRGFGGTPLLPQSFFLTKVGTESNLDYSIPVRDDDAISIKIAAREAATIRHLVPLGGLVVLTSSGEFTIEANGPVTPTTLRRPPNQGYVGANNVQPVVVNTDLVFAAARGGHIYGMGSNFAVTDSQGYVAVDLSVRAAHLFDFKTIVDMAFTRAPTPIVWCVSSSGDLVAMTYVPGEEVRAFHTHFTDGWFESVCAVAEGDEDILYVIVRREIGGATVRYVECFAPRFYTTNSDAFFVDSGVTYSGTAATAISGLSHLTGETVAILADGGVVANQVVIAGAITLDVAASKVQIGLPLQRDIRTLPVAVENVASYGQGSPKNLCSLEVRVLESGTWSAGPALDSLREIPARTDEVWGSPPGLQSGYVNVSIDGSWNDEGQVYILSTDPTPLTLASMTKVVEFGG